jgi:hypothetical protein
LVGAQEGQQRSDFPVVEWTVYLRNAGKAVTPIVTNIQALDVAFQRGAGPSDRALLKGPSIIVAWQNSFVGVSGRRQKYRKTLF